MISVLHIFDMFSINRFTRPQGKLFGLLLTFHLADRLCGLKIRIVYTVYLTSPKYLSPNFFFPRLIRLFSAP